MSYIHADTTHDQRRTVILRLRDLQKFWASPTWAAPDWMDNADNVGKVLSQLAGEAADMIEWYSEGVVPEGWKGKGPKG